MGELLIGFTNKGDQEMMLDSLEASLLLMRSLVVPLASPSTLTTETPPATSSSIPCLTRPSRSSNLTKASILRPSSCTCASLVVWFCCSFLALTFSQARRLADPRRWSRQEL